MTRRALHRPLAASLAALLAGCASGAASAPAPTPAPHTVARTQAPPPASGASSASAHPPPSEPALDPAIEAALARIDERMLRADLEAIVGPRHARSAPAGLTRAADHIARELAAAGFGVTRAPVTSGGAQADNVIGERPGPDPSRVILVAAHYDTVPGSPGADDDASGVAAILALARALGPLRTGATLRLVAFAFEEDGLVGSERYVASLSPDERRRIEVAVSLDMIAYRTSAPGSQRYPAGAEELVSLATGRPPPTTGEFIGWIGGDDVPAPMQRALREARAYVPELPVLALVVPRAMLAQLPDLQRGDHARFWAAGVPAISVGDTAELRSPHYHRPTDTLETLDLGFAVGVTRWLAASVLLAR